MATATTATVYYTSAPIDYDGFSTTTLAVVGRCLRSGNPIRKVSTDQRDLDWQTGRYASGLCRYTSDRVKLEDYVAFGDWEMTAPVAAPAPDTHRAEMETAMAEQRFKAWMRAVDQKISLKVGLSADDLPDVCYRDWFDDGLSPAKAAARAIRSARDDD